ncbi:GDSL-type esterase/lipase family protein [Arthrobacter rhizosphaerae]|uniref:GDSL-type esterase/lipase family protein n=1 Tax=Arthrobacter rhizosphaerae TaxID=2855490 RepID=UPI001FF1B8C6|nr:GDSL-type esterase/lipase family protein [Arthrobacter rhizosphaerae]
MRNVTKVLVVLLLVLLAVGIQPPGSSFPRSMAALGDSITRAHSACCHPGDQPELSWSTGSSAPDGIYSHYRRLLKLEPGISRNNSAVSGATAADLPAQAAAAASQRAEYVTILIGANDLCASSPASMTSVEEFEGHVMTALAILDERLPHSRVFISSIPDLYQLWAVLHGNPSASAMWAGSNICQSMLSGSNTEADRQTVVQRQQAFNSVLARSCSRFRNCRWDRGAVYAYRFTQEDVSTLDYFHPGLRGQEALAELTWMASYWGP